ncbi:DUF917 family protein [Pseudomaricurvus alkylphenolicus]|uniref:S-methyl thiohydantoin desulfurase domain-containing protein n=1 Tax=Pseudomaricurvus alkylphenolicus TaxID=1306991 RepID=UPI00142353E6|nr:DUF917 family protein [Pseudomaricurvus alkylphenolicus]NIB42665.1 DUF917 family protein [Pseudomaricurvus alkylphenolicus]
MAKIVLDNEVGRSVVYGGAVLGGGGGGTIAAGFQRFELATAMGTPTMISLDDLNDDDLVITASAVGAPTGEERFFMPVDIIKAMELVQQKTDRRISGIIPNENGPASGLNGWLQSAMLKIPMVDAPANGRAHPTGLMGGMGINRIPDYHSVQSAVGGNPDSGRYLEMVVEGQLQVAANLVRQAAVESGGLVMVVRDPLPVSYLKTNAAPGATTHAMSIGRAMMNAEDAGAATVIDAIVTSTAGDILCAGKIEQLELQAIGGYTLGKLKVQGECSAEVSVWNEYMTLDIDGVRHSTFPDLITIISQKTGMPLASSEIANGEDVVVLCVPRCNLILGTGVLLPETLREAEQAINRDLYSASLNEPTGEVA